jgi:Glycosyl hydrolase family 63 C-terminal domain
MNEEQKRLAETKNREKYWKRWGCYLSERAWGTVREDYSPNGSAWDYFPFEHANKKAFRWNEDGIAGICDRKQRICFSLALWNENDTILKERLFGLAGPEGNHGEDVKECYFYLDSTPTHSYMKYLYKYPHAEFPYELLKTENAKRSRTEPEFELIDSGIFNENRYFDVFVEYAKADHEDICVKITAFNRSAFSAPLHILPTVWFRNTWSWGENSAKPNLKEVKTNVANVAAIELTEALRGNWELICEGSSQLLFTENETNLEKLYGAKNVSGFAKDGINDFIVDGKHSAVNSKQTGTKAAAHYAFNIAGNSSETIYLRLRNRDESQKIVFETHDDFIAHCESIFAARIKEADEFYNEVIPETLSKDAQNVMRQAFAGMLWSKQFYHYVVKDWLDGDSNQPKPPKMRKKGRNSTWHHLYNDDVISMPDKWEYPWYAAWDLAFHCIPLALIDSEFAKDQLILMLREWYMHPNGQIPAYEWKFEDVNPPVHAWAAMRVYQIEKKRNGFGDTVFLEKIFHKLLLNFTWWVNRKDAEGNNVFEGGFLGLDNIGVFDRSSPLPTGGFIEQSDGTSWMAMYSLNLLAISMELAKTDKAYEDVASKFFEHFVYISEAMNNISDDNIELWNERDGFYYDVLHTPDGNHIPLKVRSLVGLIPLFAIETLECEWLEELPEFNKRMDWFLENRSDLTDQISSMEDEGVAKRRLLSLVSPEKLRRILRVMLSENEFLSDYGIRALSRWHKHNPYVFTVDGINHTVEYEPAESKSGLFGGNSNWRGPIWFPVNYLLIESLQKFHRYYGDDFKVEFPTGSEKMLNLWEVSQELSRRLSAIFLQNEEGNRAVNGNSEMLQTDEHWKDLVLFYEYFHGDNGSGIGASHQTGWTGLVAKLLQQSGE